MGLKVALRKIVQVSIVPWDVDDESHEQTYGISYTTTDGYQGNDPVGTKEEAERLLAQIRTQRTRKS